MGDRLAVDIHAEPFPLDETEVAECPVVEHNAACVIAVQHFVIEMRISEPGRPGVHVEPGGVVRTEVHTSP